MPLVNPGFLYVGHEHFVGRGKEHSLGDSVFDRLRFRVVELGELGIPMIQLFKLLFEKLHVASDKIDLLSLRVATGQFGQRDSARGVELFFVVSALTLCLSSAARSNREALPTLNFYIRRFFRIAPMFYIAIMRLLTVENCSG